MNIANGPGKFDLMVAFFDRFGPYGATRQRGTQRTVTFATTRMTSRDPKRAGALGAVVRLDSLKHEDGSGHAYVFTGQLVNGSMLIPGGQSDTRVKGFYNSMSRSGYIKSA